MTSVNFKKRVRFFSNICVRNGCFIYVEKFRKGSDNGERVPLLLLRNVSAALFGNELLGRNVSGTLGGM